MSISYPLSLPAALRMASVRIGARAVVAVSQSPFTGQQQVQQYAGQLWQAAISMPPMVRSDAEDVIAFLLKLNGKRGTFLLGDPTGATARGIATGTPLVNGAHAASVNSLVTDGWTISQTGILKAGDYIQLGSGSTARMYKNLSDVNSDGSGNATLDIWPGLRSAAADNAPIVISSCKSVFRLASNDMTWDIGEAQIYGIEFSAVEAI
jgi:hypothetical protein